MLKLSTTLTLKSLGKLVKQRGGDKPTKGNDIMHNDRKEVIIQGPPTYNSYKNVLISKSISSTYTHCTVCNLERSSWLVTHLGIIYFKWFSSDKNTTRYLQGTIYNILS